MKNPDQIIKEIIKRCEQEDAIVAVYLFGSAAMNRMKPLNKARKWRQLCLLMNGSEQRKRKKFLSKCICMESYKNAETVVQR